MVIGWIARNRNFALLQFLEIKISHSGMKPFEIRNVFRKTHKQTLLVTNVHGAEEKKVR